MTLKAWTERVDASWLGKKKRRERLQSEVDRLLKSAGGRAAFPRFDEFRSRLILVGQHGGWFSCTATICICGELLRCAESGGTMNDAFIAEQAEHFHATEAIRHLRNAVCHPAHVSSKHSGPPHVLQLCDWLNKHSLAPVPVVHELRKDFGKLGERWVAETALQLLEVTAQAFEERYLS